MSKDSLGRIDKVNEIKNENEIHEKQEKQRNIIASTIIIMFLIHPTITSFMFNAFK